MLKLTLVLKLMVMMKTVTTDDDDDGDDDEMMSLIMMNLIVMSVTDHMMNRITMIKAMVDPQAFDNKRSTWNHDSVRPSSLLRSR